MAETSTAGNRICPAMQLCVRTASMSCWRGISIPTNTYCWWENFHENKVKGRPSAHLSDRSSAKLDWATGLNWASCLTSSCCCFLSPFLMDLRKVGKAAFAKCSWSTLWTLTLVGVEDADKMPWYVTWERAAEKKLLWYQFLRTPKGEKSNYL